MWAKFDNGGCSDMADTENDNSKEKEKQDIDIFGSLLDLGGRVFIVVVIAMLDCIEQTFANMTYASGKNFKWVLLVVCTYLPISILSPLFGYRSCITWQDSIIAILVTCVLYAVNGINKMQINAMVVKIKEVNKSIMEGTKHNGERKR